MSHNERLERRLRVISFLFVAVAFLLVLGSFIMAAQSYSGVVTPDAVRSMSASDTVGMLLSIVTTERFITRLLFMALFVMQLGLLFMLYLLFSKLKQLISHEIGGE
ncbi:MAG TPA: hypothetical protein VIV61_06565 [Candidatus Ozemobacteraceae bacterium]